MLYMYLRNTRLSNFRVNISGWGGIKTEKGREGKREKRAEWNVQRNISEF